jgi:hypothetical protein
LYFLCKEQIVRKNSLILICNKNKYYAFSVGFTKRLRYRTRLGRLTAGYVAQGAVTVPGASVTAALRSLQKQPAGTAQKKRLR